MFYCDPCADKKVWPQSLARSYGRCEICDKEAVCNDIQSSRLPLPKVPRIKKPDRVDKFLALFTDAEKKKWKSDGAPNWVVQGTTWFLGQEPGRQELFKRLRDE